MTSAKYCWAITVGTKQFLCGTALGFLCCQNALIVGLPKVIKRFEEGEHKVIVRFQFFFTKGHLNKL